MPQLVHQLARLGTAWLSQQIGEETIALLDHLDHRNLTPIRLAELLHDMVGTEGVLLDPVVREELIGALDQDDASQLARLLNVDASNPWEAVSGVKFRRGSGATGVLYRFFSCSLPETPDDLPDTTQPVSAVYPLFAHQRVACREVLAALEQEPRRVLLHMPTGAGKTRTAMNVVAHYLREVCRDDEVVVWLAHTEELCEQAAGEFARAWSTLGDREVALQRHFASHTLELSEAKPGLVLAGLQKLYKQSLSRQSDFLALGRRVRLVIMDEAHQATAPTYNLLLRLLAPSSRTAILGLSATPGRSWMDVDEDLKLADFFARKKVKIRVEGYDNPVQFLQDAGYLAHVEYEYINFEPKDGASLTREERAQLEAGLDIPRSVIERLAGDHVRNYQILLRTVAEANPETKILVFACGVRHAELLANLLKLKGVSAASVTGETPAAQRRNLIGQYLHTDAIQVLTNYGVLTAGFDAPRTNVAIITRPTRSVVLYSQMVGRAARGPKAGGNEYCKVVTVVDRIPGFRSIGEGFQFWDDVWELEKS